MVEFSIQCSLAAPAPVVFDRIGGFGELEHLLPSLVTEVHVEKENGKTVRTFRLKGTPAKEELLAAGPAGYTYSVVPPGPPIQASTLAIRADGDCSTVEWSACLDPGASPDAAVKIFNVFNDGITNLRHQFNDCSQEDK